MTMEVICCVVPGNGGNQTKPEVEVKLEFMMLDWMALKREVIITERTCLLRVNTDAGVPPSNYYAAVFFRVTDSHLSRESAIH